MRRANADILSFAYVGVLYGKLAMEAVMLDTGELYEIWLKRSQRPRVLVPSQFLKDASLVKAAYEKGPFFYQFCHRYRMGMTQTMDCDNEGEALFIAAQVAQGSPVLISHYAPDGTLLEWDAPILKSSEHRETEMKSGSTARNKVGAPKQNVAIVLNGETVTSPAKLRDLFLKGPLYYQFRNSAKTAEVGRCKTFADVEQLAGKIGSDNPLVIRHM